MFSKQSRTVSGWHSPVTQIRGRAYPQEAADERSLTARQAVSTRVACAPFLRQRKSAVRSIPTAIADVRFWVSEAARCKTGFAGLSAKRRPDSKLQRRKCRAEGAGATFKPWKKMPGFPVRTTGTQTTRKNPALRSNLGRRHLSTRGGEIHRRDATGM